RYAIMASGSSICRWLWSDFTCAGMAWGIRSYFCDKGIVHGLGGCFSPWTLHSFSLVPRSERNDLGELGPCTSIAETDSWPCNSGISGLGLWRTSHQQNSITHPNRGITLRNLAQKCWVSCPLIAAVC